VDNSKTYSGGWYLIGPINNFITFPATNVNIDFAAFPGAKSKSLATRAGSVTIDLSFSF